ncbi:6,7-dimethyl-8-ribityllumazine synthase [Nesterenkonia sp. MY13]|uniref:6,7-dimethyl-8-ribityllumazine synthase n=1 Tax=Nesterenkonia sedimenti TaxID=1463632 RepID=A0A7X8TK25_9MICC|nr:6,7-dimethyl-8-ribityllumazine synthase [Nesterenkonia sedimenti]NLS10221.1 6,7-dimethyl-8-ribityllumazine synthase [Nesterenkonia sedimenti]
MSGTGALTIDQDELATLQQSARDFKVAVVASRWHTQVMDGLTAGAHRFLKEIGIDDDAVTTLSAPGSFELPVLAKHAAAGHDVVIALGVVIRGGTPHFDYVCSAATEGLTDVSVSTGTPVGFGLLTCDTEDQALDRAGLEGSSEDKGYEAAHAAVAAAAEIAKLQG